MRVVKINALWCSACLVMNKVWKKIEDKYNFEVLQLDYDMDEEEVEKYNVGEVLPVFIFFDGDKEILRVTGEKSEKEFLELIKRLGE
ncbi:MAG: thioredoxin family protein [Tenericutes bacterium]|nr:thioredoxin family protein [Mycoplasmatota bacterium]